MSKIFQFYCNRVYRPLRKVDITRHVANHLVGRHHTRRHRRAFGTAIILIGVLIAKAAHFVPFGLGEIVVDGMGYAIHGVGLIPWIEPLEEKKENLIVEPNTVQNEALTPQIATA